MPVVPSPTSASPTWRLDGVVAEVIYPTFGLFIDMVPAPDLQMACAQVYNDWLAETFLRRPEVFVPTAVVPSATSRRRGRGARPGGRTSASRPR